MGINGFYSALLAIDIVVVVIASLLPGNNQVVGDLDKVGHLVMYASLAFFVCLNFPENKKRVVALILGIVLGALMEIIQSFIPGRSASMFDQIANTAGILAGTVLFYVVGNRIDLVLSRLLKAKYVDASKVDEG